MASISGPSSITINDLPVTWTASGFSNPDLIEWDVSGGDASGSGTTCVLNDISNKDQTITITATDGKTTATKSVTVSKVTIPVTSFSASPTSVSIYKGSYANITYSYSPTNANSGTLPYLSSGGTYCDSVISTGSIRITGTAVGSETLTFSNSAGISFKISVTVKNPESSTTEVTSMTISTSSITIMEGESAKFTVTVSPSTATNLNISISNPNTTYLSTSQSRSGATTTVTVRGLKYSAGRCRLLITALGGSISSQYVDVYVTAAPVYVSNFYTSVDDVTYLSENEQVTFAVTAQPTNADNTAWTHSVIQGSDVASVTRLSSPANRIMVVPEKAGTVVIQLKANDANGHTETRTFIINSNILVSEIYVNYQGEITEDANIHSIKIAEGRSEEFCVVTRPANATDPTVSIENQGGTGEATITQTSAAGSLFKYRVTGVKQGTVTFLISTNDNSDLEYVLTIYIDEKVNDDFPYDLLQYHTVYPFEEAEEYLLDTRYTIVDSTYKVHAGYVDSPLDLKGMYIPLDGQNITSVPAYDSAAESKVGVWLQGMHKFFIREFYIYVTNENNQTVANKITVRKRGDFVKTLRYSKNPPAGVTVVGVLPPTETYDGTGNTVEYQFEIPESSLTAKGYVFVGWREYKDNTPCYVYKAGEKFKMKGDNMDITLYAEWFPVPKGASGTGTLDDPFKWVIDAANTPLNLTIPNVGDYPIKYRGTFPEIVTEGVVITADGVTYPTIDDISLNSGVMTITGNPVEGFESFRFVQIGQRAYQIDFNLTVVTLDTPDTPSEPTGQLATVTFNPNGGTMSTKSVETNVGKSIVLPDATYTGMYLIGWYTAAVDGEYVGSTGDRYLVPGSITLYAQWKVAPVESAKCYLAASHNGVDETMYFDLVDSIDDTMTSNLSSYSTLVFGAANRYIIDLGNSRRFSINVVRDNPPNYSDSSTDQRRWSNGKWLREFFNFIDFWQNFGRDPRTGKNTGGMRFYFEPPAEARELYPVIDKNVFISGTITPSYSGPQKIQLSIPLQVASMAVSSAGDPSEKVTYKSGKTGMGDFTQSFTKGSTISIPSMPSEWLDASDGSLLVSWKGSDGKVYYPNEGAKLKNGMTLTALWKTCWYRGSAEDSYWEVIDDGRLMVYAVGGGGSGASCKGGFMPGGAGGAGRTRILTIPVRKGDVIEWIIGKGGKPNTVGNQMGSGKDGKETIVTQNGLEILRAEGGKGGKTTPEEPVGGPYTGIGGQGWGSGGTANIPQWHKDGKYLTGVTIDVKGGDGSTVAPNTEDNVGKGHYGGDTLNAVGTTVAWMGGSGGGASGLNIKVGANLFYSRGGNGGYVYGTKFNEVIEPGTGLRGGGGGSGPYALGGAGGDGFVLLIFYSA